jgi:hypothetical protein
MSGTLLLLLATIVLIALIVALYPTSGRPTKGRPPLLHRNSAPNLVAAPIVSTAKYRTTNGTRDYTFRFQHDGNQNFRIFVEGGTEGLTAPHLISSLEGNYICWTHAIQSYEDAKAIAAKWAEAVEHFRKTGQSF